ncbi:MAG: hypothetical protein A2Z99_02915 [Treponema sp. GWB1_62_6]|nr:MAG: hypothetical protein A2Y36_05505 [Treponema sp. GWA1_62_8]OHE69657.1 MAG: hypothetical protein A2001_08860 [Treponema sp. GWC1_61_84]OHE70776.1 MAG: hypothetical protein A2413_10845 [Treponema sp. RIFOXYC1_FULL_61_9]OHE71340.1 MAG: hypothetical protein A2Z99_02915 [Treponema sp. GWB1_62_6]HCM25003.1 MFS transporter [Treponema sp.]
MIPSIRVLFAIRLINSMGNFVFPFLTMLLTIKLGYSKAAAGSFMSAAALAAGFGMLCGGKLGDVFGKKRTIAGLQITAGTLLGVCAVLGLVPVVPFLVAVAYVLLQASWPVFNALVADIVPSASRKRAFAVLYWGNNIGFSIGPLMAGYLFNTHASFMFIGNAVSLAIVSFLLVTRVKSPGASAAPASGHCGEEAPEDCGLPEIMRKRPILVVFALANLLMHFIYMQHLFGLPVFLNEKLGERGPAIYGMVMTTNGITVVTLTALVTFALIRLRSIANMAVAALFYSAGFGMLAFGATTFTVLASTVVWTIGEIISATNAQVFIAGHTPSSHRGRVNAFMSFVSGWGGTLCPVATGAYIDAFGSGALWPAVSGLALVAAFLMALIARADKSQAAPSRPISADTSLIASIVSAIR